MQCYKHPSTELEKAARDVIADPTKDFSAEFKPALTKPKIPRADVQGFLEICLIIIVLSVSI